MASVKRIEVAIDSVVAIVRVFSWKMIHFYDFGYSDLMLDIANNTDLYLPHNGQVEVVINKVACYLCKSGGPPRGLRLGSYRKRVRYTQGRYI